MANKEAAYSMNEKMMGECVIFNIEKFMEKKHEERTGTNYDRDKIDTAFKEFGYKTHSFQNPTKDHIQQNLKKVIEEYQKESSSFICFILSHGASRNKIMTHDNITMDLNEIIQICDQPVLAGKPKIFVVQACRGNEDDIGMKEGDTDNGLIRFEEMMPIVTSPDFLIIYATPPGYVSYRRENDGTPFIQMLCHALQKYRTDESVCVLFQRLVMAISCLPLKVTNKTGWFLQVPFFVSTLRKSLFLHHIEFDSTDSKKINTTINSEAEVLRRKIVRLLHEGDSIHSDNADYHNPEKSLYHLFMLEEVSGCYDLSVDRVRYCLVINKASVEVAKKDSKEIETAMKNLKFEVKTLNDSTAHTFQVELKNSLESRQKDGKHFSCVFCFIQIDADKNEDNELTTIIGTVKNEYCFLNRPKVYIIQRYQASAESKSDGPKSTPPQFVRYSKESDVLIVQALPAIQKQDSFIKLFCKEYKEKAGAVCIIGFLQHIFPGQYPNEWKTQQPTICSSMRKHLIMADSFVRFCYKNESEKNLCETLQKIIESLEKQNATKENATVSTRQDDLHNEEDKKELEFVKEYRLTPFYRTCRMISNEAELLFEACSVL